MTMRLHREPLIVDNFAGGGGASLGIELALGRSPDIAVNHDPEAVAMHAENHPSTRHYCESVWDVDPVEVTQGRPIALAWFSPDCKHFSRAKGGKPVSKNIRSLADVVIRWARAVKPRVICLENVEEFQTWGPLLDDGTPCPIRKGLEFRRWRRELEEAGYQVEMKPLRACDYGAPTTRKRLFIIARCDGQPIVWPEPTHGPGLAPYRSAASCIDWSDLGASIFERSRPLVEATLRRIGRGMHRYVLGSEQPYTVQLASARIAPTLVQGGYGERIGQAPRCLDIEQPLGTAVAGGIKHALVSAFLAKHYGGHEGPGSSLRRPLDTITAADHHALVSAPTAGDRIEQVRAFLLKYYDTGAPASARRPLDTITTRDRFGLVSVTGVDHQIADILMRMLFPRELYNAQGFPPSYRIDFSVNGTPLSKTAQVRMVGNSVSPPIAAALVRANCAGAVQRREVA